MNLKVDVLEVEEGPSMGGAMLAAVGCGAYPDVETIGKKMAHVVDTLSRNRSWWRNMRNATRSSESFILQ
mgnify:CR=1 FL=1